MRTKLIFALLMLIFSLGAWAQKIETTKFKAALTAAKTFYNEGQADSTIEALSPYLSNLDLTFQDKDQKMEVYRLAALSYILLEQDEKAEKYIKQLVRLEPNYEKTRRETDDFQKFYQIMNRFIAIPQYTIGAKYSTNTAFIREVAMYQIFTEEDVAKYQSGTGLNFGISAQYYFRSRLGINADLQNTYSRFSKSISGENNRTEFTISQIEVPLMLRFYLLKKKYFTPYFELGGYTSFLVTAKQKYEINKWEIRNSMNFFSYGPVTGAGLSINVNLISLNAALRYYQGVKPINNPKHRFYFDGSTDFLLHKQYSLMDDIELSKLQLEFGLSFSLSYKAIAKQSIKKITNNPTKKK